jgi:hypothetical protein
MILPNVRASFGRTEAQWLIRLLGAGDASRERHWESVLADHGIDPLLDDPRTLDAILRLPTLAPMPPSLVVYVFLRGALLENGIESRLLCDYVTSLFLQFGREKRSFRIREYDDQDYEYLVDLVAEIDEANGQRGFLLRAHLGNYALWLSGLFPDHIVARVHRKGGPGLDYYETLGRTGYRLAAKDPFARQHALDDLYSTAASAFKPIRRALNDFSDGYLLPQPTSPVDRVLRQADSAYQANLQASAEAERARESDPDETSNGDAYWDAPNSGTEPWLGDTPEDSDGWTDDWDIWNDDPPDDETDDWAG